MLSETYQACVNLEMTHSALVLTRHDRETGQSYVIGILLVPTADYAEHLTNIGKIMAQPKSPEVIADELRAAGYPVLRYNTVNRENPCSEIFIGWHQYGRSRRGSSSYLHTAERADNAPKDTFGIKTTFPPIKETQLVEMDFAGAELGEFARNVKATAAGDYPSNQIFICQNCGKNYVYGQAKEAIHRELGQAGRPIAFCCAFCQRDYLQKRGRMPAVGAEIPLGKPEVCNLRAAVGLKLTINYKDSIVVGDEICLADEADVRQLLNAHGVGAEDIEKLLKDRTLDLADKVLHLDYDTFGTEKWAKSIKAHLDKAKAEGLMPQALFSIDSISVRAAGEPIVADPTPEQSANFFKQAAAAAHWGYFVKELVQSAHNGLMDARAVSINGRTIKENPGRTENEADFWTVEGETRYEFQDIASAVYHCLSHPGKGYLNLWALKYGRDASAAEAHVLTAQIGDVVVTGGRR